MRERRFLAAVVLVAAIVTAGHIALVHGLRDQRQFLKYVLLADGIVHGAMPAARMNDVSPLYLWLMAALRALGGSTELVRAGQIALTGVVAVLAGVTARRLAGEVAGWSAAIAILASRAVLLNATELEPETLILLLNALAIWLVFRRNNFAGGLAIGASCVARPTAILTAIILGIVCARSWRYVAGVVVPIVALWAITFAITGHGEVMNPGTVFYEGMNARATGYLGARPAVVDDLSAQMSGAPDPLHVAFRLVASRALGRDASPDATNRYWTAMGLRFARAFPREALRLTLRKAFFALHSHEAWDLSTMVRRSDELPPIWIPFGVLVGLAVIVMGRQNETLALLLIAASYVAAMSVFHVTARQRNAMLPAMAILAGLGVARAAHRWREALLALCIAILLTYDYAPQREERYDAIALVASQSLAWRAAHADPQQAIALRAEQATWAFGADADIAIVPPSVLDATARAEAARATSRPRLFDIALALEMAGDWRAADDLLALLQAGDYRPERQAVVSSIAFYRGIALLHLQRASEAMAQFRRARDEAPADDRVLALAWVSGDAHARDALVATTDPFTARMAIVRVLLILGRRADAVRELRELTHALPEWRRATILAEVLR
jgi:tetratricopeptide (TPR) repeat protein